MYAPKVESRCAVCGRGYCNEHKDNLISHIVAGQSIGKICKNCASEFKNLKEINAEAIAIWKNTKFNISYNDRAGELIYFLKDKNLSIYSRNYEYIFYSPRGKLTDYILIEKRRRNT